MGVNELTDLYIYFLLNVVIFYLKDILPFLSITSKIGSWLKSVQSLHEWLLIEVAGSREKNHSFVEKHVRFSLSVWEQGFWLVVALTYTSNSNL